MNKVNFGRSLLGFVGAVLASSVLLAPYDFASAVQSSYYSALSDVGQRGDAAGQEVRRSRIAQAGRPA